MIRLNMKVDLEFVEKLERFVPLSELKSHADGALKDMVLLKRGRLSVQPVTSEQFDFCLSLARQP
jgi:predicted RNA-binding protein with PUA-like domain